MARKRPEPWTLPPADRARLLALLDAVPADADQETDAFVRLCRGWLDAARGRPWDAWPTVGIARTSGGGFIADRPARVVSAIREAVGRTEREDDGAARAASRG